MSDTVLVTEREYRKAEEAFRGQRRFQVVPVPPDEQTLAETALKHGCRAVIVGTQP